MEESTEKFSSPPGLSKQKEKKIPRRAVRVSGAEQLTAEQARNDSILIHGGPSRL